MAMSHMCEGLGAVHGAAPTRGMMIVWSARSSITGSAPCSARSRASSPALLPNPTWGRAG